MFFRTYQDLSEGIIDSLSDIPPEIDLVVGIPKSGLLAATIYSLFLNLPLTTLELLLDGSMLSHGYSKTTDHWIRNVCDARKILIVEDSINTGRSIAECKKLLSTSGFANKAIYLAIYATPEATNAVDHYVEVLPQPRMFEWNFLTHSLLRNCCFDIDGVLCPDPLPEQNDDGDEYRSFIANAPTKLKPQNDVGYIVTSRLEKYRNLTDLWLRENGISYNKMFMHDAPTQKIRMKLDNHGEFKASIYKSLNDAVLFFESDDRQAQTIYQLTGKPVFCTSTQKYYHSAWKEVVEKRRASKKAIIKQKMKKVLPKRVYSLLRDAYRAIKA